MEAFIREMNFDIEGVDLSQYPFNLPVIQHCKSLQFDPAITFIIGDNGVGKSTLIEALAEALGLNIEGGSSNFQTREAKHSELVERLKIVRGVRRPRDTFFLRAESFYNVASAVDAYGAQQSYGGKSLHAQSHGESFMALMEYRFRGDSLYIMDEPEAALSVQRQMKFLAEMRRLVRSGSQLIVATHSPIVLSYPDARILEVTSEGLRRVAYENTDQYQLTKYFLGNHRRMLDEIFGQ